MTTIVQQVLNKQSGKKYLEEIMKRLFVKALINKFHMEREDAVELAKTVEKIFNGEKEVEDMTIDKYARSLFYELQRERLLKLRRDEYKEKGKIMRKYYWSFNNEIIKEEAYKEIKEEQWKIYEKIPKNAWLVRAYCT